MRLVRVQPSRYEVCMKRKLIAAAVLLTAFAFVPRRGDRTKAAPPMQVPTTADAGRIWLIKRTQPAFDRYTDSPTPALQQWMRDRFFRMIVHSPYFDQRTQWYSGGILYIDAYAVYPRLTGGVNIPQDHPEWILRDVYDNPLYIPWGCDASAHTCPQYAGDFTNGDYQQWWVDRARNLLGRATHRGLWIDDVNMDFRVGNGDGRMIYPMDRKTGQPMTQQNWRRYMAEFMEKVRRDLPDVEITHNAIWFAGGGNRDEDEFIRRQIMAADYIDIEHGVNDRGLSGGDGFFSWRSMLDYIDRVNSMGRHVILDGIAAGDPNDVPALEYAACLLLSGDRRRRPPGRRPQRSLTR